MTIKHKNIYAFFIRRLLKHRKTNIYRFSVENGINTTTIYNIAKGKTKIIHHETLVKIAKSLGYWDLREFVQALEQFQQYGIIVKPKPEEDYTPRAVATFCVAVLLAAGLYYYLAR